MPASIGALSRLISALFRPYFGLISGLTFVFYWSDKRKAKHDQWRIPEGTLHFLEFLGGWPAALLAQRFLRHKTKKTKYQVVFWLIVGVHQLFSFEIVSDWCVSRSIWQEIEQADLDYEELLTASLFLPS